MCPCNLLAKRREQWFFAGMFIDTIPNRTSPPAILLRESYRAGGKVMKRTSKVKAHDEQNSAGIGDLVLIMETRPLSATKRWRVVEILERAK